MEPSGQRCAHVSRCVACRTSHSDGLSLLKHPFERAGCGGRGRDVSRKRFAHYASWLQLIPGLDGSLSRQKVSTMASEQSALRPLTLPSLPPDFAHLSNLKLQLSQTQQAVEGYAQLRKKLETFTDEPAWEAYVRCLSSSSLGRQIDIRFNSFYRSRSALSPTSLDSSFTPTTLRKRLRRKRRQDRVSREEKREVRTQVRADGFCEAQSRQEKRQRGCRKVSRPFLG